jgi:hypothetical protein
MDATITSVASVPPLGEFQADVLRGETIARALLKERGQAPRFFRHPFLNVGADLETRRALKH